MNSSQRLWRLKIIALFVLAAGLYVGGTSAKLGPAPICKGKFTLPFVAQWGSMTLPAGDYTFDVQTTTLPAYLILHQEQRGTSVFIKEQNVSARRSSDQSSLIVVRSAGSLIVHSLRLRELGVEYEFATPKGHVILAQQPELIQRIEILGAGKKS
jgi:hypothetical protein